MTREVFNQIAPSWYNFRHWSIFRSELEAMAQRWQKGRLLNLGCAHGPDFLPFKEHFELYGVDFSSEMLKFAHKYSQKFNFAVSLSLADVSHLPYPDETFDWAISVATYHHIKGKDERQVALNELKRILKPEGEAFITVWNRWQPRFWFKGREVAVPWRKRDETLYRYYYLFSYPELKKLVKKAGFKVLKSFPESSYRFPMKFFSRNICLLIRKESRCIKCGRCCQAIIGVRPTEEEVQEIEKLGYSRKDFLNKSGVMSDGKKCPFLIIRPDGVGRCRIYEKRPQICRDYFCDGRRAYKGLVEILNGSTDSL